MVTPYFEYQWFYSISNEPDIDRINEQGAAGWELIHVDCGIPPGTSQRQWVYIMKREVHPPEVNPE